MNYYYDLEVMADLMAGYFQADHQEDQEDHQDHQDHQDQN